jgi:hypothetical protein
MNYEIKFLKKVKLANGRVGISFSKVQKNLKYNPRKMCKIHFRVCAKSQQQIKIVIMICKKKSIYLEIIRRYKASFIYPKLGV